MLAYSKPGIQRHSTRVGNASSHCTVRCNQQYSPTHFTNLHCPGRCCWFTWTHPSPWDVGRACRRLSHHLRSFQPRCSPNWPTSPPRHHRRGWEQNMVCGDCGPLHWCLLRVVHSLFSQHMVNSNSITAGIKWAPLSLGGLVLVTSGTQREPWHLQPMTTPGFGGSVQGGVHLDHQ